MQVPPRFVASSLFWVVLFACGCRGGDDSPAMEGRVHDKSPSPSADRRVVSARRVRPTDSPPASQEPYIEAHPTGECPSDRDGDRKTAPFLRLLEEQLERADAQFVRCAGREDEALITLRLLVDHTGTIRVIGSRCEQGASEACACARRVASRWRFPLDMAEQCQVVVVPVSRLRAVLKKQAPDAAAL